ncbi:MAG: hypothetical protein AB1646_16830 [Thermodesulfobacteriota bacterium]
MARNKNKKRSNAALAVVNPTQALTRPEHLPALPTEGRLGRMFAESEGFRSEGAVRLEQNWNRIGTALHRMQAMAETAADVAELTADRMERLLAGEGLISTEKGGPQPR